MRAGHDNICFFCIVAAAMLILPASASVALATMTEKDVKVIARVIALVENGPRRNVQVAVIDGDGAAQEDIRDFLSLIGDGKMIGDTTLTANAVPAGSLDASTARVVLIPSGLSPSGLDHVFAVASSKKLITISTSEQCLHARKCAIAFKSDPAVDIKLSASAAQATGVRFGSTFRMIVKEVP